ncbi:MAG: tol-pal system protein YbgF [Deltaproteobacteria bacterium]|nr:tol-pal system protein YbgF [Deltaproteobacteria bacterium]
MVLVPYIKFSLARVCPGSALILALALGLSMGCGSKAVTKEEFDGLDGRVTKLEDTVYRGAGSVGATGFGGQYPPGGVAQQSSPFAEVFGPAPGQKSSASERASYNRARSLLKQKKYSQAATAFSQQLSDFPGGSLAPNARYWLGECRYAVGDYSGAFLEFRQGFGDYPQSNKAPDYLLKMSYCQSLLGDGPGAMETLRILLAKYPDSDSARLVTSGRSRFAGI